MEPIKDTIAAVIQNLTRVRGTSDIDKVETALKKVLTKKEMEHIKFKYFKNGLVHLLVDSSAWMYRLSLEKEMLVRRLKEEVGAVKDVRFYIGDTA